MIFTHNGMTYFSSNYPLFGWGFRKINYDEARKLISYCGDFKNLYLLLTNKYIDSAKGYDITNILYYYTAVVLPGLYALHCL